MNGSLQIEVCYALPDKQELLCLTLDEGTTARQAIEASGLLERHPEINLAQNRIGVFGKLVRLDAPLRDRDRVEIYRPLTADPKEVRRQRALQGKAMGKAISKGGGKPPP